MTVDATVSRMESICDRLEAALAQVSQPPEKRPSPYTAVREKYPNAGKPWNAQHDDECGVFSAQAARLPTWRLRLLELRTASACAWNGSV